MIFLFVSILGSSVNLPRAEIFKHLCFFPFLRYVIFSAFFLSGGRCWDYHPLRHFQISVVSTIHSHICTYRYIHVRQFQCIMVQPLAHWLPFFCIHRETKGLPQLCFLWISELISSLFQTQHRASVYIPTVILLYIYLCTHECSICKCCSPMPITAAKHTKSYPCVPKYFAKQCRNPHAKPKCTSDISCLKVVFQITFQFHSSLSVASVCKPVHREVICLNQRKYGKIAWKYIKIIMHYFVMLQNWLPADFILSLLSKKKQGLRAYRKLVPIFFKLSILTASFILFLFLHSSSILHILLALK